MTNRISRLKTALFANTREISLERALLYTASHRQTEGEPVILRRAKATAYILEHVEISIRDEELIAGNRTVKPRAGIMSPEMDPYWLLKELDQFPTRPQDRFAISEEDKRIYREELFPYWEKRSMKDFINGQMTDEVKAATSTQIFSINQTDKGQGHIIIDYPRLLNHGLGELVAQMQQHCQQQPENHFYQAALLLLEASQKHILRYAELAETMAANCTDAQRREELLTIAEISRHNAEHKPQTFWQACQLFWYMNIILQYESNASSLSLGRFDQYMLPFYQASLTQGEDPAFLKELLESLWVKCNDIVLLRSTSSARYFAGFPTGYTALLGGLTENGRSAVNVLSFLCLDAYQSVQLPQPNLGVRTNALIDTPFLMKTAETIRLGTGIPQIFNDEVVVPAFLNRGVSLEDARDYSVVGCVELSIPGRTYGLHDIAMFNLLKVMEICLYENEGNAELTYEGLLEQIRAKISHYITLMVEGSNICDIGHRDWAPVPLLSSFISDCLEKGRDISLDALEREVMKDDIFFRTSGGGVTLSGGEVLMQAEFATRFLQRLRLWGVSCAIETAGDAPASKLLPLAKLCDEVLFDLKIMDATQARDVVKMNLPRVLENLRLLVSEGVNVIPRLPLIPGFTLSRENMQQALDVLIPLKIRQIHLLPFHQYGEPKYRLLGKTWSMKEVPAPSSADVTTMREMAERAGFQVTVGG